MTESGQRQSWIDKARKGDQAAVSALLATYHSMLRARAVDKMGPVLAARLEAEDVLQQVYLEVLRKIESFEGRDPQAFLNWTLTILDHKLADARRALHRLKRDVAREQAHPAMATQESCINLLEKLYAQSGTPSRIVRREEAVGALIASVSRLSDTYRQVIQLRFLEGRSVEQVAERLGKSSAAVKMLTMRALAELRELMGELGEFTRSI
jgi:RNA polymerase sigma-70 factor (ECF subfamily)